MSTFQFVAIAAHPPRSSYHNVGAPLSGRGLVQVWSVLHINGNEGEVDPIEKPKRGHNKSSITKEKQFEIKRLKGRPRQLPLIEHIALDGKDQFIEGLDSQVPENTSNLLATEGVPGCSQENSLTENPGKKHI